MEVKFASLMRNYGTDDLKKLHNTIHQNFEHVGTYQSDFIAGKVE